MSSAKVLLCQASEQLGISLTEQQQTQLLDYAVELEKWNKTYNLTAVRQFEAIIKRHLIDALSVVPYVQSLSPKTLADIGTGGGIPGIILAIVLPGLQVDLVESIGKKCRFLRHVVNRLHLDERVSVQQIRVENWQINSPRCIIICRAFTSLENFTTITRHLGDQHSYWLAMKSAQTGDEESRLPADFKFIANQRLMVPFAAAKRHLLVFKRE
ncbi:MAG: 16S rRNA (guanine(527)-N(7))-methyltransferase RsmG [Gammaproteobacteria bacterium]|nr:MAG: 16S rRNA (guanine(527)-N(7))-methyltransferase RsmG [Gammaproteobacteria bacterium]